MNIIIISIICVLSYILIYEKWPVDFDKILKSILLIKHKILYCYNNRNNNNNNNNIKNLPVNNIVESYDKSEVSFNYNLLSNSETQSLNQKNKRPFMTNLKSWYNNSYFDSNTENNQYIIKNFNNDINQSEIYYNDNINYVNNTNEQDIGKSISQVYDNFVYNNYTVK